MANMGGLEDLLREGYLLEGRQEGIEIGRQEGQVLLLKELIQEEVEMKFGTFLAPLSEYLEGTTDVGELKRIHRILFLARSLDEFRTKSGL